MEEFFYDVTKIDTEHFSLWYSQMSEERKQRCDRYQKETAKKLCIAADHLMRTCLAKNLGLSMEEIKIQVSPNGKPYLDENPVFFSISHSYPLVVCAISETPVGVDIEKIRPISGNPQRFCTEQECEYLNNAKNKDEYNERLITLWTKKEALFKLFGALPRQDLKTDTINLPQSILVSTRKIDDFIFCLAEKV